MFNRIRELFNGKNKKADETKDKFVTQMLKIHKQAKVQVVASQELVCLIENSIAYKIAIATGRFKK